MRKFINKLIEPINIGFISAFGLHIFAMFCMFLDHSWGIGLVENDIFTCIGRLAFPIFAFMIVEGYFKTSNLKKYVLRLFIFALISEIPFNLMMEGTILNPLGQNVLWTFLIGILCIYIMEKVKDKKLYIRLLVFLGVFLLATVLGMGTFCDYYYAGVYMILVFYFFRKKNLLSLICQIILMYYINSEILSGFCYNINIGDYIFCLERQAISVLALIPIWLYNGKQGLHNKFIKYFNYAFYPAHIMVIYGIVMYIMPLFEKG